MYLVIKCTGKTAEHTEDHQMSDDRFHSDSYSLFGGVVVVIPHIGL
jgi:hypothetical protein